MATSKKRSSRSRTGGSTKARGAASRSTSRSSGKRAGGGKAKSVSVAGVLEKIGVNEEMVNVWRDRISGAGQQIGEKVDLQAALDQARKLASSSADKLKKAGGKNPTMFYSGLAAILVGAGLMTAARRGSGKSRSSKSRSGGGGGSSSSPGR